ncbi:tRNA 4-thiouridine(8) synthase ThiI [Saccharobesus litoralis]|uniref:tRNA sulfurtransferase n=1 Tax=Saccharobesus litoralis TaxID=2172099 RepID=A0A2S0VTP9_9ALTE|nr:tRNA uracil 4-sulfurtransferase ThiI [Saccharobesus litoralis]AWB67596.1 tRNA 4-thiouridine(8) synthase ThiI [Saccharobesus litoralis]
MVKFVIKFHAEIAIKSKSVRKRFIKMLESNVKNVLRRIDEKPWVQRNWDYIDVKVSEEHKDACLEALCHIPGIAQVHEVTQSSYTNFDDICRQVLPVYQSQIVNKTFRVKVKRRGNHDFTSIDLERYVGGALNQSVESASVKLKDADFIVDLEVDGDQLLMIAKKHKGLGGFPIATQEDTLSLISGGFDSGVSSYLMIRKGSRTHYLFFNLGGSQHEIGVKQVAYYLWDKFGASHRVKFISVDFQPVVAEILENIDSGLMGVVLKRMMVRAGAMVAERFGIKALVTGESLGQVSSQTVTNLNVIDRATDMLIIRPLIHLDKQDIIDTARLIGTEDFAKTMPEYCGVISQRPNVAAPLAKVEATEQNFNMHLIEQVVNDASLYDIKELKEQADAEVSEVEAVSDLSDKHIVVDIRSPEEEDEEPLELDDTQVVHIPFFKLANNFAELMAEQGKEKEYLLYCKKGVMSKLQALLLHESGYKNVRVFHLKK